MFRLRKSLDVITLFHAPHKPASIRVYNILKQASADATANSTYNGTPPPGETGVPKPLTRRGQFELNVTTHFPTASQIETIVGYGIEKGTPKPASVVANARNAKEAVELFGRNNDNFIRPMVVDWNNGLVVSGDKEDAILELLDSGGK